MDIILQIKECVTKLSDRGNILLVHWVPGHRDIEGNELADQQATEAANEMVGADPEDFPITMDKKEAVAEIKKNVKEKWQRKFELSEKVDQVQEVFSEVGSRNFCLFDLILYVHSTIFQLCGTVLPGFNQY